MDIPINVDVNCTDGKFGRSSCVIINPTTEDVTHVVVKSKHMPYQEFLVPIDYVARTSSKEIDLKCSQRRLEAFDKFVAHEFIHVDEPMDRYLAGRFALWPYVVPLDEEYVEFVHERIPSGETALHRGAKVAATDGPVGQVDEFLVEPQNGHITHMILHHGHLWGKKDVAIPLSAIDHIVADTVYIKLDQKAIEAMPTIPIKRWWD